MAAKPPRPLVRVVLAGDGRESAFDLRRLITAGSDLAAVGQTLAAHEALKQAQDLHPDVVVFDRALSRDVVLYAHELTSVDRPPAVVVRSACPEPVMTIAAIVAGVQAIISRSDPGRALRDAIRWVADEGHCLPDIPLSALSRAGSRLAREDLPILLMLLRGTSSSEIAAGLGITAASLGARRSAMLRDMLGEPPGACSPRAWPAGEPVPAASEPNLGVALAA